MRDRNFRCREPKWNFPFFKLIDLGHFFLIAKERNPTNTEKLVPRCGIIAEESGICSPQARRVEPCLLRINQVHWWVLYSLLFFPSRGAQTWQCDPHLGCGLLHSIYWPTCQSSLESLSQPNPEPCLPNIVGIYQSSQVNINSNHH